MSRGAQDYRRIYCAQEQPWKAISLQFYWNKNAFERKEGVLCLHEKINGRRLGLADAARKEESGFDLQQFNCSFVQKLCKLAGNAPANSLLKILDKDG